MFKYRMSTLGDVLDEYFGDDERLKETIGSWWAWWGLPPSKLSFFTITTPHISFLNEGAYIPAGGTQSLVDALVSARGGERRRTAGRRAGRADRPGGRAGWRASSSRTASVVRAPIVVSAIDARLTFEDLVGIDALPKGYGRKVARLKPSLSAVTIYAATSLDVAGAGAGAHHVPEQPPVERPRP